MLLWLKILTESSKEAGKAGILELIAYPLQSSSINPILVMRHLFTVFISLLLICLWAARVLGQVDSMAVRQGKADSLPAIPQVSRWLEIGTGANSYQGDVGSGYNSWHPALELGLRLHFKKRFNGLITLGYGTISSADPTYLLAPLGSPVPEGNLFFNTRFFTLSYQLQVNLLSTSSWMVSISPGIGIIRFQPLDENKSSLSKQPGTRNQDETYGPIALVFPLQAGVSHLFANGFGISLRTSLLNPQTDYLDNKARLGTRSGNDQVWTWRLSLMIPLSHKLVRP
jgi:hypothetical protein